MKHEYPEFVDNIAAIMQWFDRELKDKTGNKIPPSKFPYLGSRLKSFMNKNNLTVEELKTLVWGTMNKVSKMYSPVYAFYYLDDLPTYKKQKELALQRQHLTEEEVVFSVDDVIKKEEGDDFFDGI